MRLVAITCPSCGANVELDYNRDFGFCSFCGAKLYNNGMVGYQTCEKQLSHTSSIVSLIKKGFLEIDSTYYVAAAKTFDKAMEIDPMNTYVTIGKMLTKLNHAKLNRNDIEEYTSFDIFYYNILKRNHPTISDEEIAVINNTNACVFLKCYCLFRDEERVQFIIKHYPSSVSLSLIDYSHFSNSFTNIDSVDHNYYCKGGVPSAYLSKIKEMLDQENPTNAIKILLSNGIAVKSIFLEIYKNALCQDGCSHDQIINTEILSLPVLKVLIENKLPYDVCVPCICHFTDHDGYPKYSLNNCPFFDYGTLSHLMKNSVFVWKPQNDKKEYYDFVVSIIQKSRK